MHTIACAASPAHAPKSETRLRVAPAITNEEALEKCRGVVYAIVRRVRLNGGQLVEHDDLVQEGFEALLLAAKAYRADEGVSLTTYAYRRIYGACLRYAYVSQRRGLTPSHDYQRGSRPCQITSMDQVVHVSDDGPETLHDVKGATPSPEDAIDLARERAGERPIGRMDRKRKYTHGGHRTTLQAWANVTGIPLLDLYDRVVVKGWTLAQAIEAAA